MPGPTGLPADPASPLYALPTDRALRLCNQVVSALAQAGYPAKADPARLGPERAIWGSYYENDPVVCAGLVAEGQARLARFAARIERQAA